MSHDTWFHRGVRVVVRPLARTALHPNHLTTARLVTGVAAAAAFASGEPRLVGAGAVLFLLSMVFDRADGELARLSGKTSRFGHLYDIATDAVCDTAVLAGIGLGSSGGNLGGLAVALGVIAGASVAATFYLILRMEGAAGHGGGGVDAFAGFDPDDAMVLIPLAMLLGFGEILLLAAAALAPLSLIIVAVVFRRRLARARR